MHSIEKAFLPKGRIPGSLLMLRAPDAIDLVRECRRQRVDVVHVEGFELHEGGGTQPHMEHSLALFDASGDITDERNCWDLAEEFLANYIDSGLWFNVTLLSCSDPRPGVPDHRPS